MTEIYTKGATISFSTYLGGSGTPRPANMVGGALGDSGNAIALDGSGNVYVAGTANSADFPIVGGIQKSIDVPDGSGFVAKLNIAGSAADYSTFLGGDFASANGLAVDNAGNAYVTGAAINGYFPATPDAIKPADSGVSNFVNPFVAKLNASGDAMEFASLFGGSIDDVANALALDASGNVYATGYVNSSDFPVTSGAFQTVNKGAGH